MTHMTHDQLVNAARRWLLNKGCRFVVTEFVSGVSETPDAAGWTGNGHCIVVECKTSRDDFFANKQKSHEQFEIAIGDKRWFLVPEGLIKKHEIPDEWGLIEYAKSKHTRGYFCREIILAPPREKNETAQRIEKQILISAAYRALEALKLVKPLSIGEE